MNSDHVRQRMMALLNQLPDITVHDHDGQYLIRDDAGHEVVAPDINRAVSAVAELRRDKNARR